MNFVQLESLPEHKQEKYLQDIADGLASLSPENGYYREVGETYGYPECCISLFIENCGTPWWFDELPWYTDRNLKLNGYVPCEKCSNKPRQELINDINSRRKVEKIK